jgi:demethylmenaquinone methyltransferase / 2-methoxy-6-polyprenyl-1,4-benzoquinol methylase
MNGSTRGTVVAQIQASETNVAQMFDKIAPRYDFLNRLLSCAQDKAWRRALLDFIPYRPSGFLLDVATGTGDVLLMALSERREYRRYLGVDIAGAMLTRARQKLEIARGINTEHRARAGFESMSAEGLELPDASVDCVTIAFGFRNVIHKERALAEFARILKANGSLIILEFFPPEGGILSRLFRFYFHHILPRVGRLVSGDNAAYQYLPASVAQFFTPTELRQRLYERGFIVSAERKFLFGGTRIFSCVKL